MTFIVRPYEAKDFNAALAAANACMRADNEPVYWGEAEFQARLDDPRRRQGECLVGEVERAGVVAYADGYLRGEMYQTRGFVAPPYRRQGIGRTLLERQIAIAQSYAAQQGRSLSIIARFPETAVDATALFRRRGFELVRYYFDMKRDLRVPLPALDIPTSCRLATWEQRRADRAVYLAFEEAFEDHWGHGRVPFEMFTHWLSTDQWQTVNSFIVWAGDQVAGGALNDMGPEAARRWGDNCAQTALLFVRRPWRRQGVGRALLVATMQRTIELGHVGLKLRVDAQNPTGALRLYESVGFTREFIYVAYQRPVAQPTLSH